MSKITAEDIRREELMDLNRLKRQLRSATRGDFQIVEGPWTYPYAASFYGCHDIAVFKRKADCQRFIDSFPAKAALEGKKDE